MFRVEYLSNEGSKGLSPAGLMNLTDFIQLGIGGVAIVALVIIVKEFLKFVKHQEDNFTEVIKNHLHDDTESRNKLEKSHLRLAIMIEQLIKFLESSNNK